MSIGVVVYMTPWSHKVACMVVSHFKSIFYFLDDPVEPFIAIRQLKAKQIDFFSYSKPPRSLQSCRISVGLPWGVRRGYLKGFLTVDKKILS